nr:SUMF1/EgtB/PvdO family nonheme iron enzyme [Jiella sp. LLJ827]
MISVPAGTAVLGSNPERDEYALSQEVPEHTVSHKSFALSAYHITVREWLIFQRATSYSGSFNFSTEDLDHPKRYVNFFDACRFADWVDRGAKVHGLIEPDSKIMLPSEAEWEIAARGRQGRIYPWGNEFRPLCNFRDNSGDKVCAVGSFSPDGDSLFGFKDMAGNVWEWTRSLWGESGRRPEFCYPYKWNDGRENLLAHSKVRRVVRGGAYYYFDWCLRCATRNVMFPHTRHSGGGFRLLKSEASGAEVAPIVTS